MSETRTEKEILADYTAAQNEFAALMSDRGNATLGAIDTAKEKLSTLYKELSAYVSNGAEPCKNCGQPPMGMLKTPAHQHNGIDLPDTWEVGCVFCAPFLVERPDGKAIRVEGNTVNVKRRSYSARAFSPESTVKRWNAGEFVEDFYLERIPGFTPEFI